MAVDGMGVGGEHFVIPALVGQNPSLFFASLCSLFVNARGSVHSLALTLSLHLLARESAF